MHCRFRIPRGFVVKALTSTVNLDTPLHHQRPGDERALWHGPGTVTLIATQVGQARAKLPTPGDGAAVVTGVAGKDGVAHLGQQRAHHRRVAAKTVARQDHRVAGQSFDLAVGPRIGQAQNAIACVAPQLKHLRLVQQPNPSAFNGRQQSAHQGRTGFLWQAVHAAQSVPRVEKTVQEFELQAVVGLQVVDDRANGRAIGRHQMRCSRAARLGLDIYCKALRVVVQHTRCALGLRARCRDETR